MPSMSCPDDVLLKAADDARAEPARAIDRIDDLLTEYVDDPRLLFLRGSLLASEQRYDEALSSMRAAVVADPNFAIARFQLGLLELTSGNANGAQGVWAPLEGLAPDDPLRLFSRGLILMAKDEFALAYELIEKGIALNYQNAPLNRDMGMVLSELRPLRDGPKPPAGEDDAQSSAQMLLKQSKRRTTKH